MAKQEKNDAVRTSIDELNETLTTVEQHVENNKKIIVWSVIGIAVVAAIILLYYYGMYVPNKQKAVDAISKADIEMAMGNDSIALVQYKEVADNYSSAAASRAALEAAIALYQQGKYEDALNYLNKTDLDEEVVAAAAESLKGDCNVNLNNLDEALGCYDKAISISNDNALYTPLFMLKKATIYNEQGDAKAALNIFETIKKEYSNFAMMYQVNIDEYIARAKAQIAE